MTRITTSVFWQVLFRLVDKIEAFRQKHNAILAEQKNIERRELIEFLESKGFHFNEEETP